MKSSTIIAVSVLGTLMMIPSLVSAEEASTGATTGATAVGTSVNAGTSASGTITPPSPPKPLFIRESPTSPIRQGVVAPRDAASGQATGKRMMASGTRPLPPTMERRMEIRDEILNRKMGTGTPMNGEQKERTEERRGQMKERMQERRGEMLKRMSMQMITRMKAAIERFTKLSDRIDLRIAKMKEKGINTTTAEANIAIVRAKIVEATAAVSLAEANIDAAVLAADSDSSSTPKDVGKSVREALQKAQAAVKEAHKALVTAVASLRANVKVDVTTEVPVVTP